MNAAANGAAPAAADALRWNRRGADSAAPESSAPERSYSGPSPQPPRRGGGRRLWILAGALGALLGSALLVRYVPWGGPLIADGLRSLLGERAVAWLEERSAGVEDLWMRSTHRHAPPRRLGDASPDLAPLPPAETEDPPIELQPTATFAPALVTNLPRMEMFAPRRARPPFAEVAAVDDGVWYPVRDPAQRSAPPFGYRTLIHPDPDRSFAELFVVAMPVRQIALHLVPGTLEPETSNPEAARLARSGLIDAADDPLLLAAFNGGFKSVHGHHGVSIAGVELAPLQAGLCTISGNDSGALRIASWRRSDLPEPTAWYRQSAACMLESGVLHPGLVNPESRKWGTALEGDTVIRRSAIGLDRSGEVLYVGVSNSTTARALALGMQSAGAWNVAQLDINWSYPRFLIFPRAAAGPRYATTLFSGFLFEREEMLRVPSPRDFFYVTRRAPERSDALEQQSALPP
jgi:hypothetical protein